jgi:Protein of unknown function, DUF488
VTTSTSRRRGVRAKSRSDGAHVSSTVRRRELWSSVTAASEDVSSRHRNLAGLGTACQGSGAGRSDSTEGAGQEAQAAIRVIDTDSTAALGRRHTLLTIGHSTHTAARFGDLLTDAGVSHLVDVRIGPGSRRNPQFHRTAMEQWAPHHGMKYRWEQRLGGFRSLPPESPDGALRNESFRAYAAHMPTTEFREAIDVLLEQASQLRTAIMCSESLWWRCHRRLIADSVALLHLWEVLHVMPNGRLGQHRPTPAARVARGELYYDLPSSSDA